MSYELLPSKIKFFTPTMANWGRARRNELTSSLVFSILSLATIVAKQRINPNKEEIHKTVTLFPQLKPDNENNAIISRTAMV